MNKKSNNITLTEMHINTIQSRDVIITNHNSAKYTIALIGLKNPGLVGPKLYSASKRKVKRAVPLRSVGEVLIFLSRPLSP